MFCFIFMPAFPSFPGCKLVSTPVPFDIDYAPHVFKPCVSLIPSSVVVVYDMSCDLRSVLLWIYERRFLFPTPSVVHFTKTNCKNVHQGCIDLIKNTVIKILL